VTPEIVGSNPSGMLASLAHRRALRAFWALAAARVPWDRWRPPRSSDSDDHFGGRVGPQDHGGPADQVSAKVVLVGAAPVQWTMAAPTMIELSPRQVYWGPHRSAGPWRPRPAMTELVPRPLWRWPPRPLGRHGHQ
jgi:hypothetical protein